MAKCEFNDNPELKTINVILGLKCNDCMVVGSESFNDSELKIQSRPTRKSINPEECVLHKQKSACFDRLNNGVIVGLFKLVVNRTQLQHLYIIYITKLYLYTFL